MATETWEQEIAHAWGQLQTRLAEWLSEDHRGETVVIELPWRDDERAGVSPYVQVEVAEGWCTATP